MKFIINRLHLTDLSVPSGQYSTYAQTGSSPVEASACSALLETRNLTLTISAPAQPPADGTAHCYVRGIIYPAIHYHVQLPLPENWNGRFLQWGDGGKDGDLDFRRSPCRRRLCGSQ